MWMIGEKGEGGVGGGLVYQNLTLFGVKEVSGGGEEREREEERRLGDTATEEEATGRAEWVEEPVWTDVICACSPNKHWAKWFKNCWYDKTGKGTECRQQFHEQDNK